MTVHFNDKQKCSRRKPSDYKKKDQNNPGQQGAHHPLLSIPSPHKKKGQAGRAEGTAQRGSAVRMMMDE
jgi:hypothetical protein